MLHGGVSQFVPFCPCLSSFVLLGGRNGDKSGQKRTKRDKTGHLGTNWETPPFSILPLLALLKISDWHLRAKGDLHTTSVNQRIGGPWPNSQHEWMFMGRLHRASQNGTADRGLSDFVRFAPILSDFRWGFADTGKQSADFVQFRADFVQFWRSDKIRQNQRVPFGPTPFGKLRLQQEKKRVGEQHAR